MLGTLTVAGATVLTLVAAGRAHDRIRGGLARSAYLSPEASEREIDALAAAHASRCRIEEIGRSSEGRPIRALRILGDGGVPAGERPRLLVTAHLHAVEYVGGFVARAVARRLAEGYGRVPEVTALLDAAEVVIVPLANPDGAARVWRLHGRSGLARARHTATGVDPNRNFPGVAFAGRGAWNSARTRPGSAYYTGPHPLSEPECAALARLAHRDRFCAAINFHSFGRVVFVPEVLGGDADRARHALAVFEGPFQERQTRWRYRPVPDAGRKTFGQLDPFLLHGLGIPSVTVEVSRPSLATLLPWRITNVFWWANPDDPTRYAENDADATVFALAELLARTGGRPCTPAHPELAAALTPGDGRERASSTPPPRSPG